MDNISLNDEPRFMKVAANNRRHNNFLSRLCARPCSKARMVGFSLLALVLVVIIVTIPILTLGSERESKPYASSDNTNVVEPIRVGAFNIRRFGKSLMTDKAAVSNIVKIFQRYDVVLVQEVRDSSQKALKDLKVQLLNTTKEKWTYEASDSLGRSKYYREQYVFFYKATSVKLMGSHQVNDSAQDLYEREPFSVEFEFWSVAAESKQRIILVALHSKPADAKRELEHLPATIRDIGAISPRALGIIALGDFNADCNYVNAKARAGLEIFTSPEFVSLIGDNADTTVSKTTDCAYDRVVIYGNKIDARQAEVFNFETFLHLTNDEAADVSDHYPVEFLLY